jgi:hypothetical protein
MAARTMALSAIRIFNPLKSAAVLTALSRVVNSRGAVSPVMAMTLTPVAFSAASRWGEKIGEFRTFRMWS